MNLVKILNHLYEILQVSRLQVTVIKRIKSRKTSVIYLFSNVSFVIVFFNFYFSVYCRSSTVFIETQVHAYEGSYMHTKCYLCVTPAIRWLKCCTKKSLNRNSLS